jgi:hypothetical protein
MLEYLSYILFFGILIILIIYIYIRLKYGFWVIQPVFHIYDLSYYFKAPGIIDESLPQKNKYTNFKSIDTMLFSDMTSIQKNRFLNLIRKNYLQNKDNIFSPKSENIIPYFTGHNDKSFVTFYYEDNHMVDLKKGTMVTDEEIIATITARPLNVIINNDKNNSDSKFRVYYVDYLCVDKKYRKKGIAPQIIQTHHYNQRHINKNIFVSLFKREDELTGIIPLCVYSTYGFPVDKWLKPPDLSSEYKLLEINAQNYRFLYDFIQINSNKFDIIIIAEATNLLELIKTKNIFIYAILCDEEIKCCYFYRKSCVQIEKDLEVLSCFSSICDCDNDIFIQGFKISFWKIAAENFFGFSAIESISHNNIIIDNIMLKTKPLIKSPTAYFFYNFAYPTFKPEKTLIIN